MSLKRVVGVRYAQGDHAPSVILKGSGESADAVLKEAGNQTDVTIVRDPALVEQLYRVPIDSAIGKELFPVMAALLAHILNVDTNKREDGS